MKTKFKILVASIVLGSIAPAKAGGVDGGGSVPPSVSFGGIIRRHLPVLSRDARKGQRLKYLMQIDNDIAQANQPPIIWSLSSQVEVKVIESSPTEFWLETATPQDWSPYTPGSVVRTVQSRELIERASGKVLRHIYCTDGTDCRELERDRVYTDRYLKSPDADPPKLVHRRAEELVLPIGRIFTEMSYFYRDDSNQSTPLAFQSWRNDTLPIFSIAQAKEKLIFTGNQDGRRDLKITLLEFER